VRAGGTIYQRNRAGETPLDVAKRARNEEVAAFLEAQHRLACKAAAAHADVMFGAPAVVGAAQHKRRSGALAADGPAARQPGYAASERVCLGGVEGNNERADGDMPSSFAPVGASELTHAAESCECMRTTADTGLEGEVEMGRALGASGESTDDVDTSPGSWQPVKPRRKPRGASCVHAAATHARGVVARDAGTKHSSHPSRADAVASRLPASRAALDSHCCGMRSRLGRAQQGSACSWVGAAACGLSSGAAVCSIEAVHSAVRAAPTAGARHLLEGGPQPLEATSVCGGEPGLGAAYAVPKSADVGGASPPTEALAEDKSPEPLLRVSGARDASSKCRARQSRCKECEGTRLGSPLGGGECPVGSEGVDRLQVRSLQQSTCFGTVQADVSAYGGRCGCDSAGDKLPCIRAAHFGVPIWYLWALIPK
jgi:hypothetical protein